jgi:toxin CptA
VQFPVVIGLRRSRIVPAIAGATAALALAAIWAWSPGLPTAMAAALACLVLATLALRALRTGPVALMFLADGSLQVVEGPGESFHSVTVLPGGIAHPWVTVLHYRDSARQKRHVVVTVDSTGSDDFRRLRVLLRSRPVVSETGAAP